MDHEELCVYLSLTYLLGNCNADDVLYDIIIPVRKTTWI